jgi:hypothetical protein
LSPDIHLFGTVAADRIELSAADRTPLTSTAAK